MKNIVFMTNIKDNKRINRSKPYEYSVKSWKHWCEKNDVEFFMLDEFMYEPDFMKPNWYKLYVFDLLDNNDIEYNQIAVVDADTIVHPNCPNFFEMTDNKFCAVPVHGSMDWVCRSLENYSKLLFEDFMFPYYKYFNSGVMVFNKKHRKLFKSMQEFYQEQNERIKHVQDNYHVGNDQPIINFFMHKEKIDFKLLSYKFNMQDMFLKEILDEDLLFTKLGWIYHYNAIPNNHDSSLTLYWMKKTYEELYDNIS